ncbi:MAG: hypothetical protein J5750_00030 [Clostridiales bacterium]|nr:hypothetical protein [Clostridiales bacterium]
MTMIFFYAILAAIIDLLGALWLVYGDDITSFFEKKTEGLFGSYDKNSKNKSATKAPAGGSSLAGTSLTGEMKQAIEPIFLSWEHADSSLLTGRMDKTFRQMQENSIRLLQKHGLRRVIRLQKMKMKNTGKPGNFLSWNDGGRQWREAEAEGPVRDTYVNSAGQKVSEEYLKSARIAVRQSRHVKCKDLRSEKERKKQGKKGNTEFYEEVQEQRCYSCGAEISISGNETVCPFCGRPVFSNFYDWQTQDLTMENEGLGKTILLFLPVFPVTFLVTLLLFLPFGSVATDDIVFSLGLTAVGVVVGFIATLLLILLFEHLTSKEKKLKGVVRFYGNLFRSSVIEELWKRSDPETTLEMYLGEIKYGAVENTEEQSFITATVPVKTKLIDSSGRISTKVEKRKLKMVRARYPQKLRSEGEILQNKSCPSCGVPFLPDDHGSCSYCGYSLQVDNSKWKIQEIIK